MCTEQRDARKELLAALALVTGENAGVDPNAAGNANLLNLAIACREYLEAEEAAENEPAVRANMNGARIIARTDACVFIRLPDHLQRDCNGCSCSYCKMHPERTPMWDAVAVPIKRPDSGSDTTWTVHMPVAGVL